jgi:endonuclease YncB( thermonuclease family)
MKLHGPAILLLFLFVCPPLSGQTVNYGRSENANRTNPGDVSVSYGNNQRLPANYNAYYYSRVNGYAVTPYVMPPVNGQAPILLGPVRPYSDEEYARLVRSTLNTANILPAGARTSTRSIVVAEDTEGPDREYKRAEARVVDVIDRGVLIVDTREQVRLRGVRMLSEKDPNDIDRYYAREAIRTLRELTRDQTVYIEFEEPLRDPDGTLLGTVYLSDGTQLNKLLLERGLGQLETRDFTDDRDIEQLIVAEKVARDHKSGIFSRF